MRAIRGTSLPRLLAVLGLLAAGDAGAQASFTGVGDLTGGAASSSALGVSADGLVAVGESESASGTEAFRWTAGAGISGLGFLSGATPFSTAQAVSSDGSVIAGHSNGSGGFQRAYRWTAGSMTALNGQSCANCDPITEGLGVSGDGLVVVGSSLGRNFGNAPLHLDPVRWAGGGAALFDLGNLPATEEVGQAFGASSTGSVIAGVHQSSGGKDAFYWSGAGLVALPRLSLTTPVVATAYAVSSDAATIVGTSTRRTLTLPGGTVVAVEPQAVRWTGAGYATLENLGTLPGGSSIDSTARAVTPNGSHVVGRARGPGGTNRAFLWDAVNGMRDLATLLSVEHGLDLTGWQLTEARGVSGEVGGALSIVGKGVDPLGNPQGWVAVVPLPEPGRLGLVLAGILALVVLQRRRISDRRHR